MMFALLLLQAAPADAPPGDWSALPALPYASPPVIAPAYDQFVAGEIGAGRCPIAKPADGHYIVKLDVAALVAPDGIVRRAVPRAINCPTVEQYGAGLVTSFARNNLNLPAGAAPSWYRATIVFDWAG